MPRQQNYTVPVRTRITAETAIELKRQVVERGAEIGAIVRLLIEAGLGQIDNLSPVRRRRAPVQDAELFADAIRHLGSIAGNLQRLYTLARDEHRIDLPELLVAKDGVQQASALLRQALGQNGAA